jgi:hypothetical protein
MLNADVFELAKPARNRTELNRDFANHCSRGMGSKANSIAPSSHGSVRFVPATTIIDLYPHFLDVNPSFREGL